MNEPNASTSRVVRWETLPGLPADGPVPRHFHLGHPTPRVEGFVVRFWNADGSEWVGNFEGFQDWTTKIVLWPKADSIVVLAMDNFYLVDAGNPDSYVTLDSQTLVDDVMLDDEGSVLFVAESTRIHAYGRDRRRLWTRSELGGYDAQLVTCSCGVLTIEVEEELGGARKTLRLSVKDCMIL